jgi:hypothetical protein
MKVNVTPERFTVPVAFVTKHRQRIKQYNNSTVYLNNGDEFQIELFNPTSTKVMAKIDLNGISIGPGVVLRPGERVFLERYINEAKKFLYLTYEVDGNNADVQRAIVNNGDVSVKFYCETPPPSPLISYYSPWYTTTTPANPWCGNTFTTAVSYCNGVTTPTSSGIKTGSVIGAATSHSGGNQPSGRKLNKNVSNFSENYASGQDGSMSINNMSADFDCVDHAPDTMNRDIVDTPKSMETGRIEKGSNSQQSFGYDHSNFNYYWTWITNWKILPMSQKPIMREDLVIYCPSCQAKRRKESHKFCPICGTQY